MTEVKKSRVYPPQPFEPIDATKASNQPYTSEESLDELFGMALDNFELVKEDMIEGLASVTDSPLHREAYIVYYLVMSWSKADPDLWTGTADDSETLAQLWKEMGVRPSEATFTENYQSFVRTLDGLDPSELEIPPGPTEEQLERLETYKDSISKDLIYSKLHDVYIEEPTGMPGQFPATRTTSDLVSSEIRRQRRVMVVSIHQTFVGRDAWYQSFGGIIAAVGFIAHLAKAFGGAAVVPADILYALANVGSIALAFKAIWDNEARSVGQIVGAVSVSVLLIALDYQRLKTHYLDLFKDQNLWNDFRSQVPTGSMTGSMFEAPETFAIVSERMRAINLDPNNKDQVARFMFENAAEFGNFNPVNANTLRACKGARWVAVESETCRNTRSVQSFYERALSNMRAGGINEISDFREAIVRRLWDRPSLSTATNAAFAGNAFFGPWIGGGVILAYIARQQWLRAVECSHAYIGSFFPATLQPPGAGPIVSANNNYNEVRDAIDQVSNMVVLRCIRVDPFDEAYQEPNGAAPEKQGTYFSLDLREQGLPTSPMIDDTVMAQVPVGRRQPGGPPVYREMPVMPALNPANDFVYYDDHHYQHPIMAQNVRNYIDDDRKRSVKRLDFARRDFNAWARQLRDTLGFNKSTIPVAHAEQIGIEIDKWNALVERCYDNRYVKNGLQWRKDVEEYIMNFPGPPFPSNATKMNALGQAETRTTRPPPAQATTEVGGLMAIPAVNAHGALPAPPAVPNMNEEEQQDWRWLMDPWFTASLSQTNPSNHTSVVDAVFAKLGLA